MKKIYVTMFMAALCSSASLFAQDAPAKKYFLGGSVGFNSQTQKNGVGTDGAGQPIFMTGKSTNSTFSVTPEFGFFIRENTALGIKLGFTHTSGDNYYTSNSFSASPFVRFIIPLWKSRFSVYNDLGISAAYGKNTESMGGSVILGDAKTLNLGAFYEPGLQFRLKNNINLMATLGNLFAYSYFQKKVTGIGNSSWETTTSGHSAGINSSFFGLNSFRLGVNLLF